MRQTAVPLSLPQGAGLIERAFTRLLLRMVQVTRVEAPQPDFRFITLQGESLEHCDWLPGDKVQIKLDGGLQTRTYTPFEFDPLGGRMRIVGYCHGLGPGAQWLRSVRPGEAKAVLGPRSSLNLQNLASCTVLFGDETSFGLAAALRRDEPGLQCVFEVVSPTQSRAILQALGLEHARVIERRADDRHLDDVIDAMRRSAEIRTSFVLTGRAPAIQRVGRALKADGTAAIQLRSKPYWAPGRKGLD